MRLRHSCFKWKLFYSTVDCSRIVATTRTDCCQGNLKACSLRGRRSKEKGKGIWGARETRGARGERNTMASLQPFPSLPPRAPLAFLSRSIPLRTPATRAKKLGTHQGKLMRHLPSWRQTCTKSKSREKFITTSNNSVLQSLQLEWCWHSIKLHWKCLKERVWGARITTVS